MVHFFLCHIVFEVSHTFCNEKEKCHECSNILRISRYFIKLLPFSKSNLAQERNSFMESCNIFLRILCFLKKDHRICQKNIKFPNGFFKPCKTCCICCPLKQNFDWFSTKKLINLEEFYFNFSCCHYCKLLCEYLRLV